MVIAHVFLVENSWFALIINRRDNPRVVPTTHNPLYSKQFKIIPVARIIIRRFYLIYRKIIIIFVPLWITSWNAFIWRMFAIISIFFLENSNEIVEISMKIRKSRWFFGKFGFVGLARNLVLLARCGEILYYRGVFSMLRVNLITK